MPVLTTWFMACMTGLGLFAGLIVAILGAIVLACLGFATVYAISYYGWLAGERLTVYMRTRRMVR